MRVVGERGFLPEGGEFNAGLGASGIFGDGKLRGEARRVSLARAEELERRQAEFESMNRIEKLFYAWRPW